MAEVIEHADYTEYVLSTNETWTRNLSSGESLENILLDISASGAGYSIDCDGSGWAIRNFGVKGRWDYTPSSSPITCEVPDSSGSAVIENVHLPGEEELTMGDPTGVYVFPEHAGTLDIHNVYVARFGDNGLYCSPPGNPDAHPVPGAGGAVNITDSFVENCRTNVRVSTDSSTVENVVSINPSGGKSCFRDYYANGVTFRNCDAYAPNAQCFKSGSSTWNGDRNVDCGQGPTLDNCRAEGDTILTGPCPFDGSPDPNPRTSAPSGVPMTPLEAATGTASGGGGSDYEEIVVDPGNTFSVNLGDGDRLENVLIDITADGAGYSINCDGDGWEVRNVGVKGTFDSMSTAHNFTVNTPDSGSTGVIENVYLPGQSTPGHDYDGEPGIYCFRDHAGDILIRNVNLKRFADNAIYASSPGHDANDAHGGTVRVEDSYFEENATAGARLGTTGSYAENCVMVGGLHRGLWAYYEEIELRDCDLLGNSSADIIVGGSSYDKQAQAGVVATNSRWETEDLAYSSNYIDGSSVGTPQDRMPDGCPTSAEEAASGGGSSGGGGEPSPDPVDSTTVSLDPGNSTNVQLSWDTSGEDPGVRTAEVRAGGSSDTTTVSIEEAEYPESPAIDTVVDLGNQGLTDGDSIDPYISNHLANGTELRIPAGTYTWDGTALQDVTLENARITGKDPDNRPVLQFSDGHQFTPAVTAANNTAVEIRHLEWHGVDGGGSDLNLSTTGKSIMRLQNVHRPDGGQQGTYASGVEVPSGNEGKVEIIDCHMYSFPDSGIHARDNANGEVYVRGGLYKNNNVANVSAAGDYTYEKVVSIQDAQAPDYGTRVQRGLWFGSGSGTVIECDVTHSLDTGNGPANTIWSSDSSGLLDTVKIYTEESTNPAIEVNSSSWSATGLHVTGSGNRSVSPLEASCSGFSGCDSPRTTAYEPIHSSPDISVSGDVAIVEGSSQTATIATDSQTVMSGGTASVSAQGVQASATTIDSTSSIAWSSTADFAQNQSERGVTYQSWGGQPTDELRRGYKPSGNGLIGYWRFEEESGNSVIDYSPESNHGERINAELGANGVLGERCYHFGGDSRLDLPAFLERSANDWTVSLWAYPTKLSADPGVTTSQAIFHQAWGDGQTRTFLAIEDGTDLLKTNIGGFQTTTSYTVQKNQWQHFAISYDSEAGRVVVYVDGEPILDESANTDFCDGAYMIGDDHDQKIPYYGKIDELRFYNNFVGHEYVNNNLYPIRSGRFVSDKRRLD